MKIFTKTITTPITINGIDGVFFISILTGDGSTATILGNSTSFQQLTPEPVTLISGQVITISSTFSEGPTTGLTITPSGICYIQMGFN